MALMATFTELLRDPVGVFWDHDILDLNYSKPYLQFEQLELTDAETKVYTGFDETEFTTQERKIRYWAHLTLSSLTPLSEHGREIIENAVRRRDVELRRRQDVVHESRFRLSDVFAKSVMPIAGETRHKLRLVVVGTKKSLAVSYLKEPYKDGCIMYAEHPRHNRVFVFAIKSLNPNTHCLSHTFFSRYRILRLLESIVECDTDAPRLDQRTPKYFVQRYIDQHAYEHPERGPYEWHIKQDESFNPSSDEVPGTPTDDGDEGTDPASIPYNLPPGPPPTRPRTIHRSEVRSLFAMHAPFLLADQLAKRRSARVLDVVSWAHFIFKARRSIRKARDAGARWGLEARQRLEDVDALTAPERPLLDGMEILGVRGAAMRKLESDAQQLLLPQPKLPKSKHKTRVIRSPSRSLSPELDNVMPAARWIQHNYDPDMSPESSEAESRPPSPPHPALLAAIPRTLRHAPSLRLENGKWKCPQENCDYLIEDAPVLTRERSLYDAVEKHYRKHLRDLNIEIKRDGNRVVASWVRPPNLEWPPPLD